jgi:hypothetical protein
MSGDYLRVSFVQFDKEMKHKMSREGSHSNSFSREEDEQSPRNGVVLAKCILVIQFMISLNYTPNWL